MIQIRYTIMLMMLNVHISMSRHYNVSGNSNSMGHNQNTQSNYNNNNQTAPGEPLFQQSPPWLVYIDSLNPSKMLMTPAQSNAIVTNNGTNNGGTSASITGSGTSNNTSNGTNTGDQQSTQASANLKQIIQSSIINPQAGLAISDLFNFIQTCYNNVNVPIQSISRGGMTVSGKYFTVAILYTNSSEQVNSSIANTVQQQIIQNVNSATSQAVLSNNIFYMVLDGAKENNFSAQNNSSIGTIRTFLSQVSIPMNNAENQPINDLVSANYLSYLNQNATGGYWGTDTGSQNFISSLNNSFVNGFSISSTVGQLYYGLFQHANVSFANIDTGVGGAFALPNDLICPGIILLNIAPHFSNDHLIPSNYPFSISQVSFVNLKVPYLILNYLLNNNPQAYNIPYTNPQGKNYGSYIQVIDAAIAQAIQAYGNAVSTSIM